MSKERSDFCTTREYKDYMLGEELKKTGNMSNQKQKHYSITEYQESIIKGEMTENREHQAILEGYEEESSESIIRGLRYELGITETLLDQYRELLVEIPECSIHGPCIQGAIEWVKKMKLISVGMNTNPPTSDDWAGKMKGAIPKGIRQFNAVDLVEYPVGTTTAKEEMLYRELKQARQTIHNLSTALSK